MQRCAAWYQCSSPSCLTASSSACSRPLSAASPSVSGPVAHLLGPDVRGSASPFLAKSWQLILLCSLATVGRKYCAVRSCHSIFLPSILPSLQCSLASTWLARAWQTGAGEPSAATTTRAWMASPWAPAPSTTPPAPATKTRPHGESCSHASRSRQLSVLDVTSANVAAATRLLVLLTCHAMPVVGREGSPGQLTRDEIGPGADMSVM